MKNLKISMKLLVSFAIVVVLAFAIGAVGLYGIMRLDDVSSDMYENKAKPLGDLAKAMEYFQRLRVQTRNAIIYSGDSEQLRTVESDMNNRFSQFETAMSTYEPSIATENGKNLYNEIMKQYTSSFKPGIIQVLNGAKAGQTITLLLEEMAATTVSANIIADDLSSLTQARMNVMSEADIASTKLGQTMIFAIIAVILISLVVSIFFAVYVSGLISKPLALMAKSLDLIGTKGDLDLDAEISNSAQECALLKDEIGMCARAFGALLGRLTSVSDTLEQMANGDLTTEITLLSDRDKMGLSLQKMTGNLNNMFSEINQSTVQVSSGSKQIADGAQSLAQGSTEQASAVEQLSSSISAISLKTKENAEMAGRAALLAGNIKLSAEKGSRQMNEMMDAVKGINEASQNINKVITVIDNIAFQTNILALNAAVEAARAGQHGKGFAVVADEVRNLASKSAEAAQETGTLIAASMEKAELGAKIADETATSLAEIVSGINESNILVEDIAKSSDEQSEGISQINTGIDQVAQVIQQNSATAEESAAASEELSGQSSLLEELISQFKLKDGGRKHLPKPAAKQKKQLVMPEKTEYMPPIGNGDYGKY